MEISYKMQGYYVGYDRGPGWKVSRTFGNKDCSRDYWRGCQGLEEKSLKQEESDNKNVL